MSDEPKKRSRKRIGWELAILVAYPLLVGPSAWIVDRTDGSVHVTGTAEPIEHYLKDYEARRSMPNVA